MTKPNIPQILEVFDRLMADHVEWRIATSFRKYAIARDDLIEQFVQMTGLKAEVFEDHLAKKQAKALGYFG